MMDIIVYHRHGFRIFTDISGHWKNRLRIARNSRIGCVVLTLIGQRGPGASGKPVILLNLMCHEHKEMGVPLGRLF